MKYAHIVIGTMENGEGDYELKGVRVDSVWSSKKKAERRCTKLNEDKDYLKEYGFTGFTVSSHPLS